MATLIGELYGADPSPFQRSRTTPSSGIAIGIEQRHHADQPHHQHHSRAHHQLPHYSPQQVHHSTTPAQSFSDSMQCPTGPNPDATVHLPRQNHPASPPLSSSNSFSSSGQHQTLPGISNHNHLNPGDGTMRMPTPPDSSSPASPEQTRDASLAQPMAPTNNAAPGAAAPSSSSSTNASALVSSATKSSVPTDGTAEPVPTPAQAPPPTNAIPSPASDGPAHWHAGDTSSPSLYHPPPPIPQPPQPEPRVQRSIMIRDLNHIRMLTQADSTARDGHGDNMFLSDNDSLPQGVKFEISAMPIGDIIEMVAALLTKITTTNDRQHDALHRNATHSRQAQAHNEGVSDSKGGSAASSTSPFSTSVLAFHGKNVPAITILSYLSRIHKYCPTTYEVFLSLLVYFDRMTERVNDLVMKQQEEQREKEKASKDGADVVMSDVAAHEDDVMVETDEGLADSSSESSGDHEIRNRTSGAKAAPVAPATSAAGPKPASAVISSSRTDPNALSPTYFVVDSYNIHRLIIAGVTCASKFFSDVFYTNARYAKVGGLPLAELNHLELQFLILNDFRLAIPIEDLDAYATMLVEFYAREVIAQRPRPTNTGTAPTAS